MWSQGKDLVACMLLSYGRSVCEIEHRKENYFFLLLQSVTELNLSDWKSVCEVRMGFIEE